MATRGYIETNVLLEVDKGTIVKIPWQRGDILKRSMELQHIDRSNSLPDIALVDHIEKSLIYICSNDFDDGEDVYLDVYLKIEQRQIEAYSRI